MSTKNSRKIITILIALFTTSVFGAESQINEARQRIKNLAQNGFKPVMALANDFDKAAQIAGKPESLGNTAETDMEHSYRRAREFLFGRLHLVGSGSRQFVKDVYCNRKIGKEDGVGEMKIPDYSVINAEHTWPQSRFTDQHPKHEQLVDLHHLYPVDSRANSARGNIQFAEVDGDPVHDECQVAKRGYASGTEVTAFEPPDSHKGNVARAIFYFSVKYDSKVSKMEEDYLRAWHELDPVDSEERRRNNEIENIQGNRNPFIDDPDLVDEIRDF